MQNSFSPYPVILLSGLCLGLLAFTFLFLNNDPNLNVYVISLSLLSIGLLIASRWLVRKKQREQETKVTKKESEPEKNKHGQMDANSSDASSILSDAPFGYLCLSIDGYCLESNFTFREWLGYFEQELSTINLQRSILTPGDEERFELFLEKLRQSNIGLNEEFECFKQDGRSIHLMLNGKFITAEGSKSEHFRFFITDLEERLKSDRDLLQSKQVVEQALKSRERFLANISHEMRTPLSGISGLIDLLLESGLNHEQLEFAEAIKGSTENLLALIKDILDVSKIDSGKMELEKSGFLLGLVLQNSVALLRPKAEEKNIRLRLVQDPQIQDQLIGDSLRLGQILLNLISNSIKFTPKGIIELRTQLVSQNSFSTLVRFSVKDTGIGIPADKLDRVFESYIQAEETTTRDFGGTGLGLTIVKKLVELQGGSITVKSKEGEGTEFCFEIPFKKGLVTENSSNEAARDQKQIGARKFKKGSILLAEDDPVNQLFISKLLVRWGLQVTIASTGKEVVDKAHSDVFDLIFMDIQMPEMNGYDATKAIRASGDKEVAIIAMTAFASASERDRCIDAGMNDYISKPFQIKELFNTILYHMPEAELVDPEDGAHPVAAHSGSTGKSERLIDLGYLVELAAGSTDFMKEMIDVFLQQTPTAIETLKQYLEAGNYEELGILAHRMKPGIGFVGISRLKETMEMIETYSETMTHLDRLPTLVKKADLLCKQALDELREERQKLD